MKVVRDHLGPYWPELLGGLICMLVVTAINTTVPYIFGKEVVDKVLISGQSHAQLNMLVAGVMGLFLLKGIFFYGQNYLLAFVANRTITDLRSNTYQHLQDLSLGFHERARTGELISRLTNDLGILQNALAVGFVELVSNSLWLIGILFYIFFISPRLALIALVTLPIAALAINSFGGKIRKVGHLAQEKAADLTAILSETLGGAVRVVKAFTMEEAERVRFQKENERNFEALMKNVQLNSTLTPVVELIVTLSLVAVLWIGGREVISGRLSTGELFSFLIYLAMAMGPVSGLSRAMGVWQQARAAAERVGTIFQEPVTITQPEGAKVLKIKGQVKFDSVVFAYEDGEDVLYDFNLDVSPGEVVALVGHSGSGKTTVVNLLPRFYDPTAGNVFIDGVNLREVDLYSLRRQIGLVPQEVVLFSTTIEENIRYGRPEAKDEEVVAAAKLANAHEFIEEFPDGYETQVGERGAFLSGGQRQRIAIARAILRDPRILILDEATSALDNESEALLQEALGRLMQGRTTFIVAHRLSTIMKADRIVVLEQGQIVETGSHSQLVEQGGIYQKLYEAGLRGEREVL